MNIKKKAYALATVLILLGVCMFGAAALITISILESKLSISQVEGTVAYYAAEAGVNDAVWRLNNNPAYSTALLNGTLNVSYTVNNEPAAGQGFQVTMVTSAQGPGYATVNVVGTSNNGNFTAQRRIEAGVFQGTTITPTIGSNAFFGGGSLSITNGSSAINIVDGDIFTRGAITINQATVNAAGRTINAMGNYVASNSTVTVDAIHAANYPPAPTDVLVPGYDFAQYLSLPTDRCTAALYAAETQLRCTPSQFQDLIGSSTSFTFPNTTLFIDGNLTFGNWVRDKTINTTGLFVVNGDFSINGSAQDFTFNLSDPGDGKAGVIVKSNMNNSNGSWNIDGILYASGTIFITNNESMVIDGAVVAGSAVNINTGLQLDLTFNPTRAAYTLGGTVSANTVQVLHWEEEY